jgi:nicotinamidase-related amidase
MGRIWDDVLTERDRRIYAGASYGRRGGFGRRPAVLVVDVIYGFVGEKPEPILESVKSYPYSCGEEGWRAVYGIRDLLKAARAAKAPVFYADTRPRPHQPPQLNPWVYRSGLEGYQPWWTGRGDQIVDEIAPQPGDVIVDKNFRPSMFFQTPLAADLHALGVDTVLVTGCTTSGCVRATVIDAFSHCFKVGVIEDCVFDRCEIAHKVNLFDMHQKYGDVVSLKEVLDYLGTVTAGT